MLVQLLTRLNLGRQLLDEHTDYALDSQMKHAAIVAQASNRPRQVKPQARTLPDFAGMLLPGY